MRSWEGMNRRKFPRVNYPCLVIIRDDDNGEKADSKEAILAHTENVGIGGVCVILKRSVRMFCPVTLELDLLDLGEHICCSGKVVWNVQRQSSAKEKPLFYDIGIEFVDIEEEHQKRVERAIEHLVMNNR